MVRNSVLIFAKASTVGVRLTVGVENFVIATSSKNCAALHMASYSMDIGSIVQDVKGANHLRLVPILRTRGAVPPHLHNVIARKAIPFQAWTGPEGSKSLRLQDFKTFGT